MFRSDVEEPFTTEATGPVPSAAWRPYLRHFQHIMEVEVPGGHRTCPRTVIEEQRRMAPDIGELISPVYYPEKALRTHRDAHRPHQTLLAGVDAINGLPILGESGLNNWYRNNIQGGTGSFTLAAPSFADFSTAIEQKLVREISNNVPEPISAALVGIGLLGLGLTRRRQKQ